MLNFVNKCYILDQFLHIVVALENTTNIKWYQLCDYSNPQSWFIKELQKICIQLLIMYWSESTLQWTLILFGSFYNYINTSEKYK